MLTTILATPRTGSTSLYFDNDLVRWFPECHPGVNTSEYFNFLRVGNYREQCKHYFEMLNAKVNDTDEHIVIKIVLPMLQQDPEIMHTVLSMSKTIVHTVRADYLAQLKSLVIADSTAEYNSSRSTDQIEIPQQEIDTKHLHLTRWIKQHAQLYHEHGGKLFVLEDRIQNRYPRVPVVTNTSTWPEFDTMAQFKK